MSNTTPGAILIVAGLAVVIFSKPFANASYDQSKRIWGRHMKYFYFMNDNEDFQRNYNRLIVVIVGLAWIAAGIAELLGLLG